jgi:hypothetical protein
MVPTSVPAELEATCILADFQANVHARRKTGGWFTTNGRPGQRGINHDAVVVHLNRIDSTRHTWAGNLYDPCSVVEHERAISNAKQWPWRRTSMTAFHEANERGRYNSCGLRSRSRSKTAKQEIDGRRPRGRLALNDRVATLTSWTGFDGSTRGGKAWIAGGRGGTGIEDGMGTRYIEWVVSWTIVSANFCYEASLVPLITPELNLAIFLLETYSHKPASPYTQAFYSPQTHRVTARILLGGVQIIMLWCWWRLVFCKIVS